MTKSMKSKTIQKPKSKKVIKKGRQKKNKNGKSFQSVTSAIKKAILKQEPKNLESALKIGVKTGTARNNGNIIKTPRVIKIPKTGGILPLIPIFAGLSALGALSGGIANVVKAVKETKAAKEQLNEAQRHNKTIQDRIRAFFTSRFQIKKPTLTLPKHALNNLELTTYAKKLKVLHFRGVFMKDCLPRKIHKFESGIVNLDNMSGAGTHWTAYRKINMNIYYFDSYGNLTPPLELVKYFKSNGLCNIFYNHTPYQTFNTVNCGHLCLKFLINSYT
ncbi:uncharacterized protein LOC115874649 [Sitophilus oryzae]|uniref:Uncharacterized protein LOC115874649 n=1 Tax=Sitophilus oryzae TaxID=7048 RepID=A0A6J2X3L9_SITOR|nr:uncharacterized protein LOC115874649 [Sitophilus oryzae]